MSMFVRSVSRLSLISMPHSRKRNPEIDIITAKLEDYFILGPSHYTVYFNDNFDVCWKVPGIVHTLLPFVCIDETLVGFRGRYLFHVYIPSKPNRYSLNIWSLCDVSSISVQPAGIPWKGRWVDRTAQQGARVVSNLTTLVYVSSRNITTDNFFTSHALAKFLLGRNLTLLGTVRKTRK